MSLSQLRIFKQIRRSGQQPCHVPRIRVVYEHGAPKQMKAKPVSTYLITELIAHLRFGCRGPIGSLLKVLVDEPSVGTIFEEASAPGHRGFDYVVTHRQ